MNELRAPSYTERADFYDLEYAAKLGKLLPVASAKAFEKVLPFNPDDIVSRARLLGHYWKYYGEGASLLDEASGVAGTYSAQDLLVNRTEHILWFVHNAPDCIFAGDYYLSCDPIKDEHNYHLVKLAWQAQIRERPKCTQTRINFALFLFHHDKPSAKAILLEVLKAEPQNEWALSLLTELGHPTVSLPLPVVVFETPRPAHFIEERIQSVEKMLQWTPRYLRISTSTVITQERVLQRDPFDLWARLDILRWCQSNFDRANVVGFNPSVAQRWFRHISWIQCNAPHLNTSIGFGIKVPTDYFTPVQSAFLKALQGSPNKLQIVNNTIGFLKQNLGAEKTKQLLFPLKEWKSIDKKSRQKLTKEINWADQRETIFDKNIDLDATSYYVDAEIRTPSAMPSRLSLWANDLDLTNCHYEGRSYDAEYETNLEQAIESFDNDLISTARIAGYYSRNHARTPHHGSLVTAIAEWIIKHIPESDFARWAILSIESLDKGSRAKILSSLWEKRISEHDKNSRIRLNAAHSIGIEDLEAATAIAESVLNDDPDNIDAMATLHDLRAGITYDFKQLKNFQDNQFETACGLRIDSFAQAANQELANVCDEIELYLYIILDCLRIPMQTLWSNEQVLRMAPNDVIIRDEILAWCEHHNGRRSTWSTNDPDVARIKTEHILWLLENVPHANLHFFTRISDQDGIPSHARIIAKAVTKQRKIHGKTVAKYRPQYPRKKKTDEKANEEDFEN
jgi:hypothetical protein